MPFALSPVAYLADGLPALPARGLRNVRLYFGQVLTTLCLATLSCIPVLRRANLCFVFYCFATPLAVFINTKLPPRLVFLPPVGGVFLRFLMLVNRFWLSS